MTEQLEHDARPIKPQWQALYEGPFKDLTPGRIVSYDEIDAVLDKPIRDNRSPIYALRHIIGRLHSRWLKAEPNVGYRVMLANEHVVEADRRQEQARTQLRMMMEIHRATDVHQLTSEERVLHEEKARNHGRLFLMYETETKRTHKLDKTRAQDALDAAPANVESA